MRRILGSFSAVVLALAVSAAAADAQTIGFKLGAAFPNLSVDQVATDQNSFTSFIGGGHIRFNFTGRVGLQAEILSVTKGSDIDYGDFVQELRLEYVEIPLLLHVPLGTGMSFAPYVFGGPSIAFEVRCRTSVADGPSVDCDDDDVFDRKSTDIGLNAGGGLAFAMGPGAILIEGRYTWGMSNINDTTGPEVKTRTPSVMIGYEIPLRRGW
jgi:opacity protein-like surface antigen